ncbi:hypothetical protein EIP75_05695 [Aquabacterium soli]|uniref:DUF3037 domain-containing protein n=1 Tax=Aquabacterium soli TaxID=2493092 RepID=A0A3R8S3C8_9BURK|nr:hypothetical protein [Aquabacterium soli]RRS05070.1 hypothetical protein EIP75_05695 [Aquabacterium soli]
MTRQIAHYGVLSHYPQPNRTEHVHIGIAVFLADGSVRVHFGHDLRKLQAIDPQVKLDAVRSWEAGLPRLLEGQTHAAAAAFVKSLGQWSLSDTLGRFAYTGEEEYLARVTAALHSLVSTPAKPSRERGEVSRLHIDLKTTFTAKGWLGKDITKHEIVERYPIGPMTTAEFALQNGRLHVIESLDLRTSTPSAKRQDARAKALVFDMAKQSAADSARYSILAGVGSPLMGDAKALMSRYSEHVFTWESAQDMSELMNILGAATGKPGLSLPH